MKRTILDQIIEIKDVLPKKQKALCNYLVLNYGKVGIMTVAELAENAGVGTTTVMRLIQMLGYDSYLSFKKELRSENGSLYYVVSYNGKKHQVNSGYIINKKFGNKYAGL